MATDNAEALEFEERFVAFIDILGWKEASVACSDKVRAAMKGLRGLVEKFSAQAKAKSLLPLNAMREDYQTRKMFNEMISSIELGAVSDCVIVSVPARYGHLITILAGDVSRALLFVGFLSRGGIALGDLYHDGNIVFGPALNRAYEIEQTIIHPRIFVDEPAHQKLFEMDPSFRTNGWFILDMMNTYILNIFVALETVDDFGPNVDGFSKYRELMNVARVNDIIEHNLQSNLYDRRKREKWAYMKSVARTMQDTGLKQFNGVS